jgi:hypothetical protein
VGDGLIGIHTQTGWGKKEGIGAMESPQQETLNFSI